MKTIKKIEKKGYKVTANIGYRNGEQCIVSYTAKNETRNHTVTQPNVTQLNKATYNKTY